ncbi:Hypothetical_protein [Hexamita inflata]|uniref:Hypothetical_protein n=1 Tax=Hexamita inflata TaxID=28002 RepID=A0AA86PYW4_9EUKA|nr:Hypothetical protein HINF_LOCUS31117 [Hexamita inflata]CAI9968687.1 Hypothetical protein HINF_LOCUS56332 [Hexamita inflata]
MTTNQRFQYGFDSSLRKPVHPPGSIIQSRIISFSRFSKHNVSLIDKLQIKLESRDILDCNRTREYQYTLRNNILGSVLSHCQFKPEQYRNSSIYGLLRSYLDPTIHMTDNFTKQPFNLSINLFFSYI